MIKYLATIWETVSTLLTGMGVTWRHMLAIRRDNVTLQYPEERWPRPERDIGFDHNKYNVIRSRLHVDIDDCIGAYDACGVCNGPGESSCWDGSGACDLSDCPAYFELEIAETGESTLFIFQDTISTLDAGDELGLFDQSGIVDSDGNIGETLVGTGVWNGSQLEVAAIASIDLTDFGGPILPGSIDGHSLALKVWDTSEQVVYNVTYDIDAGSGTFNGLFTAISEVYLCELPFEGACDCDGNVLR